MLSFFTVSGCKGTAIMQLSQSPTHVIPSTIDVVFLQKWLIKVPIYDKNAYICDVINHNNSNQFYEVPRQNLFDGDGRMCGFADGGRKAEVPKL